MRLDGGPSIDAHRSIDIDHFHRSLSSMCLDVFIDARIDRCRDEDDVDDGGGDGSARRVDRIVSCAWDRDEG